MNNATDDLADLERRLKPLVKDARKRIGCEVDADVILAVDALIHRIREANKIVRGFVENCENMPRATPDPGASCTVHPFQIEAGTVWEFDRAMTAAAAFLAAPDLPPKE